MVWYMNFCMPFLQNDSAVNFNRMILVAEVVLLLLIYTLFRFIAACQGITLQSGPSNSVKDSPQDLQQSEGHTEQKSSVIGKEEKLSDPQNPVSKLKNTSDFKTSFASTGEEAFKKMFIKCSSLKIDIHRAQTMFPIVFGHHSVAVAAAVLYTPFIYQAIAAFVYFVLTLVLIITHSKQHWKTTTGIWVVMMLINVSLMMSGLIGVGVANWDSITSVCYGQQLS